VWLRNKKLIEKLKKEGAKKGKKERRVVLINIVPTHLYSYHLWSPIVAD
jgi:hypothetical protein